MSDEGIRLYHGSYCEVQTPDLSQCRSGKDFGVGFYLTTSKEQAISFTRTTIIRAEQDGRIPTGNNSGYVSEFIFNLNNSSLDILTFESADRDWLHCVAAYRKGRSLSTEAWDAYDIVIGKIANDKTNLVITVYLDGAYGEVGSGSADNIAISLLEPKKLKDQYCFRTQKALCALEYIGSEAVEL